MKNAVILFFSVIIMCMHSDASADKYLTVHDAWVLSAPPNAKVLAAYMKILNQSSEPRFLTGVTSRRFEKVEMHRTVMQGDVMKMIRQEQMDIPPQGSLSLEPGSHHLMLINPKSGLREGDHVYIELRFDNGEAIRVKALVRSAREGRRRGQHH